MGALRRAVFTGLYCGSRALERAATAFAHVAAGTLRLHELRQAIQRQWEESSARESERHIASGLMPWEQALYLPFLRPGDRILVVGCGNGRDLLALLERGFRAEGLDLSPRCTGIARDVLDRRGLRANLVAADITTAALPAPVDVAIFSWFCYGYIPQAETRVGVLRRVMAQLNPGGRILISYIPSPAPPRRLPIRLARLVARLCGSDWQPEDGDRVFLAGPDQFVRYEHRFSAEAFEREMNAAGLRILLHEPSEGLAALAVPGDGEGAAGGGVRTEA